MSYVKKCESMKVIRNQKGSLLVVTLPLILLIITLTLGMSTGWASLHTEFRSSQICRADLLKIQKYNAFAIEKLMSLNPIAELLRLQHKVAISKLAACASTVNPCAVLALQRIAAINQRREKLDALQKTIIQQATMKSRAALSQTILRMNSSEGLVRIVQLFESRRTAWISEHGPLAVEAVDADLAPAYRLKNDFRNRQGITIQWNTFHSSKNIDTSLSTTAKQNHHQTRSACSATLSNDGKLEPTLKKVKLSQNSWSF